MIKSETIAKLSEALAKFQSEVKNPPNTAINPFYKSKYAPLGDVLNTVRPVLGKYGLSFTQNQSTNDEGKLGVTTMLMHSSGEYIETDPIFSAPEKNTPQGLGSVSTYLRRYQLSSVLGIASEDDDDGNSNEINKLTKDKVIEKVSPNVTETVKAKEKTSNNKETPIVEDKKIESVITDITEKVAELRNKNITDKQIGEVIKGVYGKMNYGSITDLTMAKKIINALGEVK